MALGGILATALTDRSVRRYGLWVDGVDVIADPVSRRYGTPIESMLLTWNPPGAPSTLSWDIEDPSLLITVQDGATVRFHNLTTDKALFTGWIDHYEVEPALGGAGRIIRCTAISTDVVLDWVCITSDITLAASLNIATAILSVWAQTAGTGEVRVAQPIAGGSYGAGVTDGSAWLLRQAITLTAGTTLRECIRTIDANSTAYGSGGTEPESLFAFVCPWNTLRHDWNIQNQVPWNTVFTVGAGGVTPYPIEMTLAVEAATYRSVFVKGTNAAGTGTYATSPLPGPMAYIVDSTSAAVAQLAGIAAAYLVNYKTQARGSFGLDPLTTTQLLIPDSLYPLSVLVITNTPIGYAAAVSATSYVHVRFGPGLLASYKVGFGGPSPSMAGLTRRLTRATRS